VTATPIAADLSEPAPGQALLDAVRDRGITVTSVINNARFGMWGLFHETDPAYLRQMLHVDVVAVADISRAFISLLRERGDGYLLNISSVGAYSSIPMQGAYSAEQAGSRRPKSAGLVHATAVDRRTQEARALTG
jgi:short-subunit dehydrogenase